MDVTTKAKANPISLLDSLKVNNLVKGQNLNVFVKSESVEIEIFDWQSKESRDYQQGNQCGDHIQTVEAEITLLQPLNTLAEPLDQANKRGHNFVVP